MGPGVVLSKGDTVTLGEPVMYSADDQSLLDLDREQARATVLVRRIGGGLDCGPEVITFAHPTIIYPGGRSPMVSSDISVMRERLSAVRSRAGARVAGGEGPLAVALGEAERLLQRYDSYQRELAGLKDTGLGELVTWMIVVNAQNAAVGFGYALAWAESEITSRPAKRLHPTSQKAAAESRGAQLTKRAAEWQRRAEPILAELFLRHPDWSRLNLARHVDRELDDPKPKVRQISVWVKRALGQIKSDPSA